MGIPNCRENAFFAQLRVACFRVLRELLTRSGSRDWGQGNLWLFIAGASDEVERKAGEF
jgi:hypothetical protein